MTREEFLKSFPKHVVGYKPSAESLQRIKNVCLLIVIGPTGAGKSAIIDRLDLPYVPTDVTRSPRPEEKDGIDMFFRADYEELLEQIKSGDFLQCVVGASGDFYGSRASSYPYKGWATMPIIADAVPLFRRLGFVKTLSVFITPPDYQEWMRRINTHKINPAELDKRLAEARRSFEFVLKDDEVHFVLNDNLNKAVKQVKDLLDGTIDKNREDQAKRIARQNYQKLVEERVE